MVVMASAGNRINPVPHLIDEAAAPSQFHAAQVKAAISQLVEIDLPGEKEPGEIVARELSEAVAELERVSSAFNKRLQFVVDHRSKEITVKVIDKETDKVIKELPPEELKRLHSALKETIGFLFDEMV
ncbi:MAG: flagellar protein FlaG [Treponema sp.]|jgi:flagellar protein FlaG|nr:flagellar protein FlaG [Treponema sp.]